MYIEFCFELMPVVNYNAHKMVSCLIKTPVRRYR